jgi:hypothetical protein
MRLVFLIALAGLYPSSPAVAADDEESAIEFDIDDPVRPRYEIAPNWRVGGRVRLDWDVEQDFGLGSEDNDLNLLDPSASGAISYAPVDWFDAYLSMSMGREIALEADGDKADDPRELTLSVGLAYFVLREVIDGLSIQVGRQRIKDEREWLLDDEFDGIRVFYRRGKVGLELSASQERLVDSNLLSGNSNSRINNYIGFLRYSPIDDLQLTAYAMLRDQLIDSKTRPVFVGL